jgi:hypothetical protein
MVIDYENFDWTRKLDLSLPGSKTFPAFRLSGSSFRNEILKLEGCLIFWVGGQKNLENFPYRDKKLENFSYRDNKLKNFLYRDKKTWKFSLSGIGTNTITCKILYIGTKNLQNFVYRDKKLENFPHRDKKIFPIGTKKLENFPYQNEKLGKFCL